MSVRIRETDDGHTVLEVNGQTVPMEESDFMQLRMQLGQRYKPLHAGRSLLERMWDNLDTTYGALMTGRGADETRARALGQAEQIALMQNTTVDVVRAQAAERYAARPQPTKVKRKSRRK